MFKAGWQALCIFSVKINAMTHRTFWGFPLLLLGLMVPGLKAQIEFTEYTMDNGLHVILHENHSTPIVAISVLYHVGSKNEDTSRTGFAHFFEHLLFEGSKHIARGEFDKYIQQAGGYNNANTSQDRTFYFEVLSSNQLELGLWLESERMLHAKIEEIGLETQREVVKEEKRLRVDNQPYGSLLEDVFSRAYTQHPYRWVPIGSMEHLNAATLEEFMEFYKTFYVPNNATLSIAGDIDIETTKKLVDKYFSGIPKGTGEIPRPNVVEPKQTKEIRDTVYDEIQLPAVVQAYHIPAQGTEDHYALQVLSSILSGGESARFQRVVKNEQEKALQVFGFPFPLEDPGLFVTLGICNMGVDPADLEKAMDEQVERLKNEPVTEKELQKVINQLETQFVEQNRQMSGIAENLANYHVYYGEANLINTELERYRKVSAADVQRVAKQYFIPQNRVNLYYLPAPTN